MFLELGGGAFVDKLTGPSFSNERNRGNSRKARDRSEVWD